VKINIYGPVIANSPFGTEIAFKKGLEQLGHDVLAIDPNFTGQHVRHNVDASIVFKTAKDYTDDVKRSSGVKIVYQPDDFRFPHIQQMMAEMRDVCDFALAFDETSAGGIKALGYKLAKEMIVTADPDLYRPLAGMKKDIDFVFIGSLGDPRAHASRRKMIQVLLNEGFQVVYHSDLYDTQKIVELYNRAHVVLNHATDVGQTFGSGFGYQCRHFEAGMTGACLLSSMESGKRVLFNVARFTSEDDLVALAHAFQSNRKHAADLGKAFREELFKRHLPVHRAAEMTQFIAECQRVS
jgi:hypothetical protein